MFSDRTAWTNCNDGARIGDAWDYDWTQISWGAYVVGRFDPNCSSATGWDTARIPGVNGAAPYYHGGQMLQIEMELSSSAAFVALTVFPATSAGSQPRLAVGRRSAHRLSQRQHPFRSRRHIHGQHGDRQRWHWRGAVPRRLEQVRVPVLRVMDRQQSDSLRRRADAIEVERASEPVQLLVPTEPGGAGWCDELSRRQWEGLAGSTTPQ